MNIPKVLYRGISVDAKELAKFDLWGDIKPISPPLKNADGKDVVADGNEYGIYMTTNYLMTKDVYGNTHSSGGIYHDEIIYEKSLLRYPKVGIVYKIDAEKIRIKKPWISRVLQGHYNNGYEGEEWITQASDQGEHIIPKEAHVITDIVIGYDLLNEKQDVDVTGLTEDEIKQSIIEIIEKRKIGYELLLNQVKKCPLNLRNTRIKSKIAVYKKLFNSKDGIAFTDYSEVDINNVEQVTNHLMQKIYNRDKDNIDITALDNIYKLSTRAKTTEQFELLVNKKIEELKIRLENQNLHEVVRVNVTNELKMLESVINFLERQYDKVNLDLPL